MKVTKTQIERWNVTKRQNTEAKREERQWRRGLKNKETAKAEKTEDPEVDDEWELEKIGIFCLVFRSKIFRGRQ